MEEVRLDQHVAYAMKRYGTMTVEDRAIPDFRDGLKPVHRRIMWAMMHEGLKSNSGYKKSARIVGQVMGKYHPHGDMAIYGSMVTIANTPTKLIDGAGNWGWYNDSAGAQRYTECRLSKYADHVLLDPEYIAVTPTINNYDGSEKEPLYLPSLLPTIFLLGIQGIAMAVTTNIPAFKLEGIVKLVEIGLSRKLKIEDCLEHLEFVYEYGGKVTSPKQEIKTLLETGQARIEWKCDYKVHPDKRQVVITGIPPYWNYSSKREALMKLDQVYSVVDQSNQEGIKIVITAKNIGHNGFVDLVENKIKALLTSAAPYKINTTRRLMIEKNNMMETSAKFSEDNFLDVMDRWLDWRIKIEKRAIAYIIKELKIKLDRELLMKKAISHLDMIFELLKKNGVDKVAVLAEKLKITVDESKYIWSIAVGRLDRLSMEKVEAEIKELNEQIKKNEWYYKNPNKRALEGLKTKRKVLNV
jgi:DNA gyrase/topoisomerase IV subunit A